MPVDEVKAIYHDNFGVKKAYAVVRHETRRTLLFSCSESFSLQMHTPSNVPRVPNEERRNAGEFCAYPVDGVWSQLSCALLEQVRRFRETGMPPDGRTEWEVDFEDVLEVGPLDQP